MEPYTLTAGPFTIELTERTDTQHHGTTVWPAGETLAHYFTSLAGKSRTSSVQGKRVLEFGSGTGILAVVLGLLGAEVTATDQDVPVILANLRANVERNRPPAGYDVTVLPHNWGTPLSAEITEGGPWDYIIAADCVYTPEPLPLLMASIDAAAGPRTTVLVAMERRDPYVTGLCVQTAKELGFDVSKVPRNKLNRDVAHESMEVYKMVRRRAPRA
ncbi:hypothetical protein H9P43_002243 [Blastocladiella emersonii ATCC 22665]|nr:hypothetical protein H9P43_002243 [Blastocladiella emersonii ATCC 22665]